jgi:tRNA G18 (ribose-2'-O)-methylase SpoU
MKDRELSRKGGRFIAEGEHLVRRLLASRFTTESVLLAERRAEELAPLVPAGVPVYVCPDAVLNQVVGFKFHSGVLGCGLRGRSPTIESVLPVERRSHRLIICQDVNNAENLGGIIRTAAGFGAHAVILGERCIDPFFRQCVRVSMGTLFTLPIIRSNDLLNDLALLKERWGVQLAATVLASDAQPLSQASMRPRLAILLGGEAQGLDGPTVALCDHRITIPMQLGTDSLNVTVAAGIVMYHFWGEEENEQRASSNEQ